jgi:membrane protein YdbS with pleckstrin-like domain
MAKIPEKGIKYKTSRISYIANYFVVVLLMVFLYLFWQKFELSFTLTSADAAELIPALTFLAFTIVAVYLLGEPDVEKTLRYYVVTNNEVMKIEGIFRKKKISIPYQSVADVKIEKGVVGRILNFGTVYVTGVGRDPHNIIMKGLRNADEVYGIIQSKINLMRGAIISRRGLKEEKE